ncbi:hypothetical protein CH06BL_07850 [Chromobacterium haemolyticum]|nr:hypothetical protein CH06BL_07850 [Chromobacterium haemolyticum]
MLLLGDLASAAVAAVAVRRSPKFQWERADAFYNIKVFQLAIRCNDM